MTAIAGIRQDGVVWLGADSAATQGHSQITRAEGKIFRIGLDFLAAVTGSPRHAQSLQFAWKQNPPEWAGKHNLRPTDDFEFMVVVFVPWMRQTLKDAGCIVIDKHEELTRVNSETMIAYHGRLFIIYADFQVGESMHDYAAIGCGRDLALGSLHATSARRLSPKSRIHLALKAAEEFSAGVRGPFVIKSIGSKK